MTPQPEKAWLSDAMKNLEGKDLNEGLNKAFKSLDELKAETENVKQQSYEAVLNAKLEFVRQEVLRAKTMFPANFVNQHEAYAVILGEVDELWDEIKKNQRNYDLKAQHKEATQAAAMLMRLIVELL